MNVAAESVRQQIESVLTAWGMDADMVRTTADAMLCSDLAGIDTHGISMLMAYEDYRAASPHREIRVACSASCPVCSDLTNSSAWSRSRNQRSESP